MHFPMFIESFLHLCPLSLARWHAIFACASTVHLPTKLFRPISHHTVFYLYKCTFVERIFQLSLHTRKILNLTDIF